VFVELSLSGTVLLGPLMAIFTKTLIGFKVEHPVKRRYFISCWLV